MYLVYHPGGCTLGYIGVHDLYFRKEEDELALRHLLDAVSEGVTDDHVSVKVGDHYRDGYGCKKNPSLALVYYNHAIDQGRFPPAYLRLFYLKFYSGFNSFLNKGEAILHLLDAEEDGVAMHDDRILGYVINGLVGNYTPDPRVLGAFQTKGEMALHYCDVLIRRGSSLGYQRKAEIYEKGQGGISQDISKAIAILEEADRVGLVISSLYIYRLIPHYL